MTTAVQFDRAKHEFRDSQGRLVPSVTQILARAGLCDYSFVEEETRRRSMDRGALIHWMLQLEDEGAINSRQVPIGLRPYRRAYLYWKDASGFLPELIEKRFISHYGYAGIVDRYGRFPATLNYPNGSRAIVDFKSGDVQNWSRFQMAGYTIGIQPNPALARTIRRIALGLHADATHSVKEFPPDTWEHDWSVFYEAKRRVYGDHVEHGILV